MKNILMETMPGENMSSYNKHINVLLIVKGGIARKFTSFIDCKKMSHITTERGDICFVYDKKLKKSFSMNYGEEKFMTIEFSNGKIVQFIGGSYGHDTSTFNDTNEVTVALAKSAFAVEEFEVKPTYKSKVKKFTNYNMRLQNYKGKHHAKLIKYNKGKLNKDEMGFMVCKKIILIDSMNA